MMTSEECISHIVKAVAECREALLWAQDDPEPLRTENITTEIRKRDAAIHAVIQHIMDTRAKVEHTATEAADTATSAHETEPSDAA